MGYGEGYGYGLRYFFYQVGKIGPKKRLSFLNQWAHENPIFQVREGYTEGYKKAANKKGATFFNVTP